jgi:hypothetical protein
MRISVSRKLVALTKSFEFFCNEFGGLLADRRALEKHRANFLFQCSSAPAFDAAEFNVELPLKRILQVNDLAKMRPGQLSPHCGDNWLIRKNLRKTNHMA